MSVSLLLYVYHLRYRDKLHLTVIGITSSPYAPIRQLPNQHMPWLQYKLRVTADIIEISQYKKIIVAMYNILLDITKDHLHKSMKFIPLRIFVIPAYILGSIIIGVSIHRGFHLETLAKLIWLAATVVGSFGLVQDTWRSLRARNFALDYIALLAIFVGIISGEYLVSAVITLMLTGGEALENYSMERAKSSLTALVDRIPSNVMLWKDGDIGTHVHIDTVRVGQNIYIRKGEVVPLDGILQSTQTYCDESSLTGEAMPVVKNHSDKLYSGTVNVGDSVVLQVLTEGKDSTYRAIVEMVRKAQEAKSPFIRLADEYSGWFTLVALLIATYAYIVSGGDLTRVLAVLVIATPCPLILATPIALMGGMNAAAARRIIFKKLGTIEQLSRLKALIFDKTGTITMGTPRVTETIHIDKNIAPELCHGITLHLEKSSLHPLAKALVQHLQHTHYTTVTLENITEIIGSGISGTYEKNTYRLGASKDNQGGMAISLYRNDIETMRYHFQDMLKTDSQKNIQLLIDKGLHVAIYTGDTEENAQKIHNQLRVPIDVVAHCKPEDKKKGIDRYRKQGFITGMVGDGINDAPALAYADVGMVFGSQDNTAATDAADVVFLGSEIQQLTDAISIAQKTIYIARESIIVGIILSTVGMILAGMGYIPPVIGAFCQEAIDVFVILNALRTSKI